VKRAAFALLLAACAGPRPEGAVRVDASAALAIVAKAYAYTGGFPAVFVAPHDERRCPGLEAFWDEAAGACMRGLTVRGWGIEPEIYVVDPASGPAWSATSLVHEAGGHWIDDGHHGGDGFAAGSPERVRVEAANAALASSGADELRLRNDKGGSR
jgi:hypothetical protein